jgi:hypothetical protein
MAFTRSLRSLLLLISAVFGSCVLAQSLISRTEVFTSGSVAKAIGWELALAEPDESGDGDPCGGDPVEIVPPLLPRMHREKAGYFLPAGRWADRRGATLVGVVQLLI